MCALAKLKKFGVFRYAHNVMLFTNSGRRRVGETMSDAAQLLLLVEQNNASKLGDLLARLGPAAARTCYTAERVSLLHVAAARGSAAAAQALVAAGADARARDIGGATPLHRAACEGQTPLVELLLRSGAQVCPVRVCSGVAADARIRNSPAMQTTRGLFRCMTLPSTATTAQRRRCCVPAPLRTPPARTGRARCITRR